MAAPKPEGNPSGESAPLVRTVREGRFEQQVVQPYWEPPAKREHAKVGEWRSTAICGNDLLSSCLYTSAIVVGDAGWLAPVGLLLVSLALKFYQGVYSENGLALPFNGGVYTAAINSLSKPKACVCACFSVMSYIATCLVSAASGVHYLLGYFGILGEEIYMSSVVALILIVMCLYIWGLSESANVALVIFVSHVTLLITLIVTSAYEIAVVDHTRMVKNFQTPLPHSWPVCILFGFASGMLGITGYETSSNYIEEQAPGVYPKTLRNMWWIVSLSNPLVTLMILGVVNMKAITDTANKNDLLNKMGADSLGNLLFDADRSTNWHEVMRAWVSIDAFIVLFGAVLTAFVGCAGLLHRLALDGCLPEAFLTINECRGTAHWIAIAFAAVCIGVFVCAGGHTHELAGLYTIAFMLVMSSMAGCHILLKRQVPFMKREMSCGVWRSTCAALLTILALVINLVLKPISMVIFASFFAVALTLCLCSIWRIRLLLMLRRCRIFPEWCAQKATAIGLEHRMVYFCHGREDVDFIQRILKVFEAGELSRHITLVHFSRKPNAGADLAANAKKAGGQFNHFTVDVLVVDMDAPEEMDETDVSDEADANDTGVATELQTVPKKRSEVKNQKNEALEAKTKGVETLTPKGVQWVCEKLKIRTNDLAMGAPGQGCHAMGELQGVRIMIA